MTRGFARFGAAAMALAMAVGIDGASVAPPVTPHAPGDLEIYFIDIGQGASVLVVSPTGKTLLFDGGPQTSGTTKIAPLLTALGIAKVDHTVLSHYHADHELGLTELIAANRVSNAPIPAGAYDNGDTPDVQPEPGTLTFTNYQAYVAALGTAGVARQTMRPPMTIDLGGGARATCIVGGGQLYSGYQIPVSYLDLNSESIGILIEYGNFDLFLNGDLTGGGTTTTARSPDMETPAGQLIRDVDVATVGHHGSNGASNRAYLRSIRAEVTVGQASEGNTFGHPSKEIVNRFLWTPTTLGATFIGTGIPPAGAPPVFYQTQFPNPTDTRVSTQSHTGCASGAGGAASGPGTLKLTVAAGGLTTYTMMSFDDGGVRINPATHAYVVDGASPGLVANFPPTVVPSLLPEVPLASDPVTIRAQVNDREDPITSVTLDYWLNGVGPTTAPMADSGGGLFLAPVPAQPDGTQVDYRISALAGGQTTIANLGYFSGTTPVATLRTQLDPKLETTVFDYVARVGGEVVAGTESYSSRGANDDYVEDGTGGINIFRTVEPTVPLIVAGQVGQQVSVRGRVGWLTGKLRLETTPPWDANDPPLIVSPYGTTINSSGGTPTPLPRTIADILAAPEANEGRLVSIANCTITSGSIPAAPAAADGLLTIDDGTGSMTMKIDRDSEIPGLPTPASPLTVIGIVQQDDDLRPFDSVYSVAPRFCPDLGAPSCKPALETIAPLRVDTAPADFVPDRLTQAVRTRGVVTSVGFRGTSGLEMFVQDATGGMVLFDGSNSYLTPYPIGTSVEVSGTLTQFNGLEELNPGGESNLQILPNGTLPSVSPRVITLDQLAAGGVGEALEGWLVRVDDVQIVAGTWPAAGVDGNLTIQDCTASATMRIDRDTNIDGTPAPTGAFSVIGLVSQFDNAAPYDSGYQLLPRLRSEIVEDYVPEAGDDGSLRIAKSGATGLEFRFDWNDTCNAYQLWGAATEAAMDAGTWSTKICDLRTNGVGTWNSDGSSYATFTLNDITTLPDGQYVVVANNSAGEGSYGQKTGGAERTHDANNAAPLELGCTPACTAVSASIDSVTPGTTVGLGTPQTFNGSGTGQGALSYAWDFEYVAPTFDVMGSGTSVGYTYGTAGARIAALRVTDSCASPGPQTAIATVNISVTGAACTDITINEIDSDTPGTDALEFVELHNGTGASVNLTGYAVAFFNGAAVGNASYSSFTLAGTLANGAFYLLGNSAVLPAPDIVFAGNVLQNGADAVGLYKGVGCNAASIPNGTAAATTIGPCTLVDSIVYDTADPDDADLLTALAQTEQIDEGNSTNAPNQSIMRITNSQGCPQGWPGDWKVGAPTPKAAN